MHLLAGPLRSASATSRNVSARAPIYPGVSSFLFFPSSPLLPRAVFLANLRSWSATHASHCSEPSDSWHSRKFSSWRRDALEGALVRSTRIPGKATTHLSPILLVAEGEGGEKKGKGTKEKRKRGRDKSFPFPPPLAHAPEIARAIQSREMLQCNRHASRGNYGIIIVSRAVIDSSNRSRRAAHVLSIVGAEPCLYARCMRHAARRKRCNLPRRTRVSSVSF